MARMKGFIAIMLAFLFLVVEFGCSSGRRVSFLGRRAPQLIVEKWLTEKPDLSGKFILIDFWATWCQPCRRSIPDMNRIFHELGDRIVVVGLSDEDEGTVKGMTNPRIDYYSALDSKGRTKDAYGWQGWPFTVIVDTTGFVVYEGNPLKDSLNADKVRDMMNLARQLSQ